MNTDKRKKQLFYILDYLTRCEEEEYTISQVIDLSLHIYKLFTFGMGHKVIILNSCIGDDFYSALVNFTEVLVEESKRNLYTKKQRHILSYWSDILNEVKNLIETKSLKSEE